MNDSARAKAQAQAQYESIQSLVTALDVDYDRLEELRGMRQDCYAVGRSMPGYLPDNPPEILTSEEEACEVLASWMYKDALWVDDAETETALLEEAKAILTDKNRDYGVTLGRYRYWIARSDSLPDEEQAELEELEEQAGEYANPEEVQDAVQQDPLSVEVRSGWGTPGEDLTPEEFRILICWGGPAVQIIGDLNQYREPCRARLQYQDWNVGWTDYFDASQETLLAYCRQFYFGE